MSRGPKNFDEVLDKVKDEVPVAAKDAAKDAAEGAVEGTKDVLGELEREFRKIWSSFQGLTAKVGDKTEDVKDGAEQRVAQSPWISIGLVGVVAFVLGYLMGGRKSE